MEFVSGQDKAAVVVVVETPTCLQTKETNSDSHVLPMMNSIRALLLSILGKLHAGYFRVSLSLCSQALLWKILADPPQYTHPLRPILRLLPPSFCAFVWSSALFTLASLSLLYALRCVFLFDEVRSEFLSHVGVNYLFAPWISWLLLLQSSPFISPSDTSYRFLWWLFVSPVLVLDVKIYGQWFTKGKRFLSSVANPTSQLSVIGNLVGARAAADMGWRENAVCLFSLGMAHYLVLFVTLYQRLPGDNSLPAMLRPVFFLFIAAPSMASLAWTSICGSFDMAAKMLFFLSLFLFFSLVCRPALFKKSMKTFTVVWWAYSFPLTLLALASLCYAREMKNSFAAGAMAFLTSLSIIVSLALVLLSAISTSTLLPARKTQT